MRKVSIIAGVALTLLLGCKYGEQRQTTKFTLAADAPDVHVPHGDAIAGRTVFLEMRCHACHRVEGENFPNPVATPDVPVVLGPAQARQPRAQLLESIIAPSCRIPDDLPNVRSGTLSRMGDYSSVMTVEQLVDLVAFIQSLDRQS